MPAVYYHIGKFPPESFDWSAKKKVTDAKFLLNVRQTTTM
jgi:hypothetical protein